MFIQPPYTYKTFEFVRILSYDLDVKKDFSVWQKTRSRLNPVDLEIVGVTAEDYRYTVKVLSSFVSRLEVLDLFAVTSNIPGDTPSYFVYSGPVNYPVELPDTYVNETELTRVDDVNGVISCKSKEGAFLYFDINRLDDYLTQMSS